jgi:predicted ATPase
MLELSKNMEDLRIRRLVLNEVGVFKHLDVSFPECPVQGKAEIHIFVGENGTGKTTLLEAMTCFEGWYAGIHQGEGTFIPNGGKDTRIDRKLHATSSSYQVEMGGITIGKSKDNSIKSFPWTRLHDYLNDYISKKWNPSNNTRYKFFAYNANRFLNTAYVKPGRQFVDERLLTEGIAWDKVTVNEALFQWVIDCDTKAAYALRRNAPEEAQKYEAELRRINEAISDILGRPVGFVIDEQRLIVRLNVQGEMIDAEQLALGYQSLIGWLADLIYRLSQFPESLNARFTLFLDEIDIHLHPKAQRRILPVIQKLFPKAQIFITTHSPFVIGSVDDAWVYKFKLDADGKSVVDGEPIRSEDGHSYRWQLRSFFDTSEQFGIEVEKNLKLFYEERDRLLQNGKTKDRSTFIGIGNELLKNDSIELAQIVNFELNQVDKILGATK